MIDLFEIFFMTVKISSITFGATFYISSLYHSCTDEVFDPIRIITDGVFVGFGAYLFVLLWPLSVPMLGIYKWRRYRQLSLYP